MIVDLLLGLVDFDPRSGNYRLKVSQRIVDLLLGLVDFDFLMGENTGNHCMVYRKVNQTGLVEVVIGAGEVASPPFGGLNETHQSIPMVGSAQGTAS